MENMFSAQSTAALLYTEAKTWKGQTQKCLSQNTSLFLQFALVNKDLNYVKMICKRKEKDILKITWTVMIFINLSKQHKGTIGHIETNSSVSNPSTYYWASQEELAYNTCVKPVPKMCTEENNSINLNTHSIVVLVFDDLRWISPGKTARKHGGWCISRRKDFPPTIKQTLIPERSDWTWDEVSHPIIPEASQTSGGFLLANTDMSTQLMTDRANVSKVTHKKTLQVILM